MDRRRRSSYTFREDPSQVLAVLDWELSTLGDPLADAAYGCMAHYFDSTATMLSGLRGLDLESMGIPSDKEYMEDYCRNMGIPSIEDTWNFYLCFGFFRMAAILQGVYKRSLEGCCFLKAVFQVLNLNPRKGQRSKCRTSGSTYKGLNHHRFNYFGHRTKQDLCFFFSLQEFADMSWHFAEKQDAINKKLCSD